MVDWLSVSGSKSHAKDFKACCEPVEKKCEELGRDLVVYKSVKGTSPFHSDIAEDHNLITAQTYDLYGINKAMFFQSDDGFSEPLL